MTTSESATAVPSEVAQARPRARWLRTALLILIVVLVIAFLVALTMSGVSADPMAGT